jgi:hypothetical protein
MMPGLLPNVDPDGLLEYSVVYTDRALNHMSQAFQGVMRDISGTLKPAYGADAAAVVPGSGTFGMEAVARQFAGGRNCLVLRNGWFSFRWTQILDMGRIPPRPRCSRRAATAKAPGALRCRRRSTRWWRDPRAARRGLRAACRNRLRHDPARRLPARRGRRRCARSGPVRARLHRLRRDVGRHARDRASTC